MITIEPLARGDRGAFLALNNACVPHVNALEPATLEAILAQAAVVLAARQDDRLIGGLIALGDKARYASANYRWFRARYDAFLYVDRVLVRQSSRGAGLGRKLYRALEEAAPMDVTRILCEVNEDPPNPISLAFHTHMGFHEVGRLAHPDTGKCVVMMERPLRDKREAGDG